MLFQLAYFNLLLIIVRGTSHLRQFEGLDGPVSVVTADEDHVYAASFGSSISSWDLVSGSLSTVYRSSADSEVSAIGVHDDCLVAGFTSGYLVKWDKNFGSSALYSKAHNGKVTAVVVESGHIYSSSTDGCIKKWNCKDLSLIETFEGDHGTVSALALFDQKLYAGTSQNGTVQFDLETGKIIQVYDFDGSVEKLVVIENEIIAVVYGIEVCIVHIDISTRSERLKYKVHFSEIVALQADSKNLYIVSGIGRFIEVRRRFDGIIVGWLAGQDDTILSLYLQKQFLLAGSSEKRVKLYDTNIMEFPETEYSPSRTIDGGDQFALEGRSLYIAKNNSVLVTDIEATDVVVDSFQIQSVISNIIVSPTGVFLSDSEGNLYIRDEKEKTIRTTNVQFKPITAMFVSGPNVFAGYFKSDRVYQWNWEQNLVITTYSASMVNSLFVHGKSLYIASLGRSLLKLEIGSGILQRSFESSSVYGYIAVAVNDDFVIAATDYDIIQWRHNQSTPVKSWNAHANYITSMILDENLVLTSSIDGSIKKFDAVTGNTEKVYVTEVPADSFAYKNGTLVAAVDVKILIWDAKETILTSSTIIATKTTTATSLPRNLNSDTATGGAIAAAAIILFIILIGITVFYVAKRYNRLTGQFENHGNELKDFTRLPNDIEDWDASNI